MDLKVHYIKDNEGNNTAIKMPIKDWESIVKILNQASISTKEKIELIETPIQVQKLEVERKKRKFSDFLMDL